MLKRFRYFLGDLGHWAGNHKLIVAAVLALALGGAATAVVLGLSGSDEQQKAEAPAPPAVIVERPAREEEPPDLETEDLGFPAFATKNTTRVAGPDPIANAAAVALAVFPSTGGVEGPDAISIVDAADWHAGLAAASLVADPVRAPILLSDGGEMPDLSAGALRALDPDGSADTGGDGIFLFGEAAEPDGDLDLRRIEGSNAAEIAAEADRVRGELAGAPDHVLIASSDDPSFAMPAAAWGARSGDPVLFTQRNSLPAATRQALERHERTPAYVLGPESVISDRVLDEIGKLTPSVERVGGENPVENAIAFARYADGTFGWNINDPGHGLVIANAERPLDAVAAAPLSASGTWGPLLVSDDAKSLPAPLRGYLLDLKPGYLDDPTRAVYNHVWLIGDPEALSVGFGAQVDELAEVAPVTSGVGAPEAEEPQQDDGPGEPEDEPR